jgi:hypothetical protein
MRAIILFFAALSAYAQSCNSIPLGFSLGGNGNSFNGFRPFASSTWYTNISGAPIDSRNATWLNDLVFGGTGVFANSRLRSLYPSTYGTGLIEGYVFHVVDSNQKRVKVIFNTAGDTNPAQFDSYGPIPIPLDARIQASLRVGDPYPDNSTSGSEGTDAHIFVFDRDSCVLYELYGVDYLPNGQIKAQNVSVWDMLGGLEQRPYFYTSGSVSGLPLPAGLPTDEELQAGVINHALAVSAFVSGGGSFFPHHSFAAPARAHQYGNGGWVSTEIPVGARLRMKASIDMSSWPAQAQVLGQALKTYGAIITDGGGTVDTYGWASTHWDPATVAWLWENWIMGADYLDFVEAGTVYCDPLYSCGAQPPTGAAPTVSITPSASTVPAGTPVTLTLGVTNNGSRLKYVSPNIGPIVDNSVVVNPTVTTTYTVMAQNQYGRSSQTVTITVDGSTFRPQIVSGNISGGGSFR